jgi:hypothetical protein
MRKTLIAVALSLIVCGVGVWWWMPRGQVTISPKAAAASHQRMISLLRSIKESTQQENPFLGAADSKKALDDLANLPEDASTTDRFKFNWLVAEHMLRLGQSQQAVTYFETACQFAAQVEPAIEDDQHELLLLMTALAHFQIAENENCVANHTADSCLLPIQGKGIHVKQEHTKAAIEFLMLLLGKNPQHATGRWLLNISYMAIGGYPSQVPAKMLISPEAFHSEESFPRFFNIASWLKVDSFNLSGGAIVDDFDNDGLLDIVSSTWDPRGQIYFFHNQGDGTFVDRTAAAGLTGIYGGLNLIQADYDNDNDLDFLVLRGGWTEGHGIQPNSLLQNNGNAQFQDVTFAAGLGEVPRPTQTASWADYDLDGDLDLFIGNELQPGQLFRNNANGTFVDVAQQAGLLNNGEPLLSKGVIFGDYDQDRWPDLFISNMGQPNNLYHNNQDGTFSDVAGALDIQTPIPSFPAWFWDFNNDGALDLFVPSYEIGVKHIAADYIGTSTGAAVDELYQNNGQGGFIERAAELNLARVTQPMGCNFGDLDNDGFLDFYLGTGYPEYIALMPNLMFHNQRGKKFTDVTTAGGFGHLQKGHGVSFADLDNDGDQDIFIQIGGWYAGDKFGNGLFENPGFGNHWIGIKLVGKQSNRSAIGTRIRATIIENGETRSVYKWVNSGGSFGANPLRQQLGLGQATRIERLEIYWPKTDLTQAFKDVSVDQFIEIHEDADQFRRLDLPAFRFQTETELPHQHSH